MDDFGHSHQGDSIVEASNTAHPRRHANGAVRLKNLAWAVTGIATSLVFVFGVGILTIQRIGLKGGGVFGLGNELVAVTQPRPAFLQLLGIAALSALVLAVLIASTRSRPRWTRFYFGAGFAATTAALIAAGSRILAVSYTENALPEGFPLGVLGWVEEGGTSSAVHVVLLGVVAALWTQRRERVVPPWET